MTRFKVAASTAIVQTASLARYYLRRLQMEEDGNVEPHYVPNDGKAVTLEHVLPQRPGKGWTHTLPEDAKANDNRLGNQALLGDTANGVKTPEKQGPEEGLPEPNKIGASTPYDFLPRRCPAARRSRPSADRSVPSSISVTPHFPGARSSAAKDGGCAYWPETAFRGQDSRHVTNVALF